MGLVGSVGLADSDHSFFSNLIRHFI
jgi:hypothetical protein